MSTLPKASFPLAYDIKAQATPRYSKFATYFIDEEGVIRAVLRTKGKPSKPAVIFEALDKLQTQQTEDE
jgi:hypothetical protein